MKPKKLGSWGRNSKQKSDQKKEQSNSQDKAPALREQVHKPGQHVESEKLSTNLKENIKAIKETMGPDNVDVVIREFVIATKPKPTPAAIVYVEGISNTVTQQFAIIQPLMFLSTLRPDNEQAITQDELFNYLRYCLIPTAHSDETDTKQGVMNHIVTGETVILIDGVAKGIVVETKSWEHRGVSEPKTEASVRGPHEAFTETLRVNTALLRRRIRSPHLRIDMMRIGRRTHTDIGICWLDGITDPKLVEEVKKRLGAIDVDILPYEGILEEYLEDQPYSIFPQVQITERPDRVAAFLSEGRVAIIVDGNPMVLVMPTNFSTYFQTNEDYTERWMYATLLRILRLFSIVNSALLPAFYIAITNYHQEMLPTQLALAFAQARENVPLPAFLEALFMIISLELVREAGLRMPSPVGSTVGIVGALLLGEAAVSANLASPILIIIIALAGLSSFILPQYSQGLVLRFIVYPFVILATGWGLFGVVAGVMVIVIHLSNLTSLGIPYLEPLWRPVEAFRDTFIRIPMWLMIKRPRFLRPQDSVRQTMTIRKWAPEKHTFVASDTMDKTDQVVQDAQSKQAQPHQSPDAKDQKGGGKER
ncbi:MAG: spore germination protein [Firmicutes bacterium]|nr:spore germination protein [Bacillota bacterium]